MALKLWVSSLLPVLYPTLCNHHHHTHTYILVFTNTFNTCFNDYVGVRYRLIRTPSSKDSLTRIRSQDYSLAPKCVECVVKNRILPFTRLVLLFLLTLGVRRYCSLTLDSSQVCYMVFLLNRAC